MLIDGSSGRRAGRRKTRSDEFFASQGVAIREVILKPGHERVDYLLYVDRATVRVIEAKPVGTPLSGVEWQSAMWSEGPWFPLR